MREDLLYFIWKGQRFKERRLTTTDKVPLQVAQPGQLNHFSGPDFFNARIILDGQEWAGNIEIHIKSSDWYAHGHETDPNYANVILHVVWEDDVAVFKMDGAHIPTLELKSLVSHDLLRSYKNLVLAKRYKFINCENDIGEIDEFLWNNWQERLFVERLEYKSKLIGHQLESTKNNWVEVLFLLLMKNFGLNKNGGAFMSIAEHLGFLVVKKSRRNLVQLEGLFFGISGLLNKDDCSDEYLLKLRKEYQFLKHKFEIDDYFGEQPVFFGLRPNNFPTIRLAQLAALYHSQDNLFSRVMACGSLEEFYALFEISASDYWDDHYSFGKVSKRRKKQLTKGFIHLLLINTIIPLKFCYAKSKGKNNIEELLEIVDGIPKEENSIIDKFKLLGRKSESAFESQAKIQLYKEYCSQNKCLQCQVGMSLLGRKP